MREAVICEPVRTPVGRFGGMFRNTPVTKLAATVVAGLVARTGVDVHRCRRRHLRPGLRERGGGRDRADRGTGRGPRRAGARPPDRPALRVGAPIGALRLHAGHHGRVGPRARGRRGEHEPGRALLPRRAMEPGRGARAPRPARRAAPQLRRHAVPGARRHDRDGREPAPRVRHQPDRAGRVGGPLARARRRAPSRTGCSPTRRSRWSSPTRRPARSAPSPSTSTRGRVRPSRSWAASSRCWAARTRMPPSPQATPAGRTTRPPWRS